MLRYSISWGSQLFAELNRSKRGCEMSETSLWYRPTDYCRLSKGRNTALRSTSVYQISKYPSSEKRIEKAFRSHSGGTNASNAFGKEILHPGFGGAIAVGTNLATMAARLASSAQVGSVGPAGFLSRITERTGSSCGSLCTCSSDSRRYLPGDTRKIQASSVSVPLIHDKQSEKYLGKVMRFEVSAVVCTGMSASGGIWRLGFYPIIPSLDIYMSHVISISPILSLTFTHFYRRLLQLAKKLEEAPYLVWQLLWRTKSKFCYIEALPEELT